jgi:alpha-ketoglutarate-dependent taurine dioxygenase
VAVDRLGLAGLELDDRRTALYALSVLLGDVTPATASDPRAVWDVRNRSVTATGPAEPGPDLEAEHHTDSALVPLPERYFLLYSVHTPRCGGAVRFLRDGRALTRRLEATADGRAALATLAGVPLPVRVPKSLRASGHTDADGYYLAPVLAGSRWRWRRDKIEAGLAARPEHDTASLRAALGAVTRLLADPADDHRRPIPDDGVLIVDNHVTLHGRTAFTDTDRHLLRVRFHDAGTPGLAPPAG